MSTIDRQRVAAVRAMEALGYTFDGIAWNTPTGVNLEHEADALHRLLMLCADSLEGCTEGSGEEGELRINTGALEPYEAKRWPDGAVPGGKGEQASSECVTKPYWRLSVGEHSAFNQT